MIGNDNLRETVVIGVKNYLQIPFIQSNQNAEPPAYPFLAYTVTKLESENNGTWQEHDDGKYRKAVTQTWSISSLSDDENESITNASKAREWFDIVGRLYLKDNGVIVQSVGTITNRDNVLTTEYEYKNGFDVVFYMMNEVENPFAVSGEYIETAKIENIEAKATEEQNSVQNPLEYAKQIVYSSATFPEGYKLEVDMPYVASMENFLIYATGIKEVIIKGNKDGNSISFNHAFAGSSVEIIDVTQLVCKPSTADYALYGALHLREVKGEIDTQYCTSSQRPFYQCYALEELRFLKESINESFEIYHSPLLSAETIKSIIEALIHNKTVTGVLKLHGDVSSRLTTEQIIQITNKNWSVE